MATFQRLAWCFVAYLVVVILFGAWVRIAGAGAGCGNHWPLCNGVAIPASPEAKTLIEFTHRVTSGLCGVFAIGFVAWAWRLADRGVLRAAWATLGFVILEGFIGAVLVKRELVANDASMSRAVVIALHLANTLLLTASAATMAWRAGPLAKASGGVGRAKLAWALAALVVTNMTGAVTALGDTLFPASPALDGSLLAKVTSEVTSGEHFLVRLRAIHPLVALLTAGFLAVVLESVRREPGAESRLRRLLFCALALVGGQVALGFLNIALAAPGWMQILHLLAAQLLWIATFLAALAIAKSNPGLR